MVPAASWKFFFRNLTWSPCGRRSGRWMPGISAAMTAACPTVRLPAAGVLWREPLPIWARWGRYALKVEVTCRIARLEETLAAVKAVHPYEEPVINVIPLYRTGL